MELESLNPLENTVHLKSIFEDHPESIPSETSSDRAIQTMIEHNYNIVKVRTAISVHVNFARTLIGEGRISVSVPIVSLLNSSDSSGEYEIFTSQHVHSVDLCYNDQYIESFTYINTATATDIATAGKRWCLPIFNSRTPIPEYDSGWIVKIIMDEDHADDNIIFNLSRYFYNKTLRKKYARAYRNKTIYMELNEPNMYLVRYSSTYIRISKDELLTNEVFSGLFRRN